LVSLPTSRTGLYLGSCGFYCVVLKVSNTEAFFGDLRLPFLPPCHFELLCPGYSWALSMLHSHNFREFHVPTAEFYFPEV
jgi:hypothetical protein